MAFSQAQDKTKTVQINTNESFVQIQGTTNVNSFNCTYNASLPKDSFKVSLTDNGRDIEFQHEALLLKVVNFKCPSSQMTNDLHQLLDFKEYPYIRFQLQKVTDNQTAHITIEMAGESKSYTLPIENTVIRNQLNYHGKLELCITDFGLVAPEKFFGMVKVNENIEVEFKINMNIINN